MSNVETKNLYVGEYVRTEQQLDGTPLGRPIRLVLIKGHYISIEQARAYVLELQAAIASVGG